MRAAQIIAFTWLVWVAAAIAWTYWLKERRARRRPPRPRHAEEFAVNARPITLMPQHPIVPPETYELDEIYFPSGEEVIGEVDKGGGWEYRIRVGDQYRPYEQQTQMYVNGRIASAAWYHEGSYVPASGHALERAIRLAIDAYPVTMFDFACGTRLEQLKSEVLPDLPNRIGVQSTHEGCHCPAAGGMGCECD